MPGFAEKDKDHVFDDIGVFEFTFYYLKRTYSTPDANRFFIRKFKRIIEKNGLKSLEE